MIGMIKKDLLMIKSNYKALLIAFIIFVFYSIYFDMNMTFFLPIMGLMSAISTINYDDFNNFHVYASSFPQGKVGLVKSKYITTIGVTVFLSILSILINFIINKVKGDILTETSVSSIVGILFAMLLMMAILFPILFKYGAEKGRIAMILVGFGIFGIITLLTNVIQINISESFINFLDLYFPIITTLVAIIITIISYQISKRIYLKREF